MPVSPKRILLVDADDARAALLATACREHDPAWEMVTAGDGTEALARLESGKFDAVVAGTSSPGLSGIDLLRTIMVRHPRTARIVLADPFDDEQMLGSLGAAHQYLPEPCQPDELCGTLARLMELDVFLTNENLRRVVTRIQQLPCPPTIYFRVMKELAQPDATAGSVGALIAQDASLTAKLLQVSNSAFFGLERPVVSVPEAVQILGFNLVKCVALSHSLFASLNPPAVGELSPDRLYLHSLATALLAQRIALGENGDPAMVDAAFTAGILHDTGKLVLASALPDHYHRAVQLAADELIPQWQAEANVFGVSHAEVGAYLLGLWGLPAPIVEAVAWHHQPGRLESRVFGVLAAVHIADYLQSHLLPASQRRLAVELDVPYVERLNIHEKMGQWVDDAGHL
jgi:putative nucleotidyltransferase with HDIG domain